ncbi:Two component transcriptional regulator, winged helix family [Candidatus Methylobacter favarea]|uniref:Two component transcriptional regulator, winged helix family n=1 Tax=Candidatus Methylobacter favarea TaxID=2707345 RepID=A0A8S0X2Y3_9GAMM|nr:response regulator transcription factor [Candidatus Methylobacter favarea]CAA9892284.1 Two component transcriptional regulator, winged helix family [Candidatus Methylobacter favarea]
MLKNTPPTHARLLLVEDHKNLAQAIGAYFESSGFTMDYAYDGLCALHLAAIQRYDALILDITLPGINGLEICRRLRQDAHLSTPILMLTARDQLQDKLSGFQQGADDYLVKPFDMPELEARIIALIRRERGELDEAVYKIHDLSLDTRSMQVVRNGQIIHLSPTGLRILRILMRESPYLVTREQLEQELWGELTPDSDTLRSHLYKLRKAIDKPFDQPLLETQQGMGFRLMAPESR